MKVMTKIFALAAVVMAAVACDTPLPDQPTGGKQFSITATLSGDFTKALDTSFEKGDALSVFAYKGQNLESIVNTGAEIWLANGKFVKGSNGFSSDRTYYWYEGQEQSVILGLYPYNAAYDGLNPADNGVDFCVKSDQSRHSGYTASDLMVAVEGRVTPTSESVLLGFDHVLSKVIIDIDNQTTNDIAEVYLDGFKGNYHYNFTSGEATGGVGTIKAGALETPTNGYTDTYVLILPPQSAAPSLAITTTRGKQYTWEQSETIEFHGGKYRHMTVTITDESISTAFDGIVNDWSADEEVEFKDQPSVGDNEKEMQLNPAWSVTWYGEVDGYKNYLEVISEDNNTYYLTCVSVEEWEEIQAYPFYNYVSDFGAFLVDATNEINQENGTNMTMEEIFLYSGSIAGQWEDLDPGTYVMLLMGINPDGSNSGLYAISEEFTIATPPVLPATHYDIDQAVGIYDYFDGAPYYALLLVDNESDSIFQLYVNVATDSTFEDGIPSGTYVIGDDYSPGTIDIGFIDEETGVGGSLITNLAVDTAKALIMGGSLTVVNEGNGNYTFSFEFTDHNDQVLTGDFSGNVSMSDESDYGGGEGGGNDSGLPVIYFNVDGAQLQYYGIGEWVLFIMDSTGNAGKGLTYMLDCWNEEDATFADGLASGTYTFADTCAPMTIYTGYVDSDGYVGGSLLLDGSLSTAYDIATNGTLEVVNNGDGTYAMTFDIWGLYYNGTGSLSGQISTYDGTAMTAPMAKSPAKSGGIKWANYNTNITPARKNISSNLKMEVTTSLNKGAKLSF